LTCPRLRPLPPVAFSGAGFDLTPAREWPFERAALRSAPLRPWLRSALICCPRSEA
jgi:hypothetical protein